ncbi:MAG: Hsp20/alpha crystallin family protein [Pirellulales bacterium]
MARNPDRPNDLFLAAARAFQKTQWSPAVDVYQTRDGWVLKYELAGISPQEVELTVRGRSVVVRGLRRDVRIEEAQQSYSMEISYNCFERSLELPCDLDTMRVSTDYRDGMLIVQLRCEEASA